MNACANTEHSPLNTREDSGRSDLSLAVWIGFESVCVWPKWQINFRQSCVLPECEFLCAAIAHRRFLQSCTHYSQSTGAYYGIWVSILCTMHRNGKHTHNNTRTAGRHVQNCTRVSASAEPCCSLTIIVYASASVKCVDRYTRTQSLVSGSDLQKCPVLKLSGILCRNA